MTIFKIQFSNLKIEIRDSEGKTIELNGLAEAVRYWGNWIKEQAEKELAEYYPKDPDGATPIAYLWARAVTCEGPGCGAEIPLMRSFWLAKKGERSVAIQLLPSPGGRGAGGEGPRVDFAIIEKRSGKWVRQDDPQIEIKNPKLNDGTVRRGSATCPVCGYTTPVESVRAQLKTRQGGAADARLFCVVTTRPNTQGRFYRLPTARDLEAAQNAAAELERRKAAHTGELSLVPNEFFPASGLRRVQVPNYGIETVGEIFSPRQALVISVLSSLVTKINDLLDHSEFSKAIAASLALLTDKQIDLGNSLNRWEPVAQCPRQLFARQSVPIVWDFAEGAPMGASSGSWNVLLKTMVSVLDAHVNQWHDGHVQKASALSHPLPDDSVQLVFTDPPYYDSVVYAHTADVFYPWLRRQLSGQYPELFETVLSPKDDEIVVDPPHSLSPSKKDARFFETKMAEALSETRRVLNPSAIACVVFAHQSTIGWEAMLTAVISAGYVVTGSWPIDTEMETRVIAQNRAVLASSIHLICRPRETVSGSLAETVGDWREVLSELPGRIHAWLPRLAAEGVVGADAIFACLGPALEIYSRYSRVETASGEQVSLKQYLEVVWAAVAREALGMIFEGADATGFEEDARLTAIWLWTLKAENGDSKLEPRDTDSEESESETESRLTNTGSYALEYDAARKIAQGLGAHLEKLTSLAQVKGDQARLLSVRERGNYLFGHGEANPLQAARKPSAAQLDLFTPLTADGPASDSAGWDGEIAPQAGSTTLDRLHQSMLLFGLGRSEALKRFLVEGGVGKDTRYWRLAQALSALYPPGSEEKRWVDGVLARKKGLGF